MRFERMRRDEGATAIEYAIIAALIGIGLIGSLVGTKTSLSAIFGTASSQMASASSGSQDAATPARFSYWGGKTIASNSTYKSIPSGLIQTDVSYKDGSTVSLRQEIDANGIRTGRQYLQIIDYATKVQTLYYVDNGKVTTFEQVTYSAMPPSSIRQTLSVDGLYSNGVLTNVRTSTYTAGSSSATSTVTAAPTQTYNTDVANAGTDVSYFMSFVPTNL